MGKNIQMPQSSKRATSAFKGKDPCTAAPTIGKQPHAYSATKGSMSKPLPVVRTNVKLSEHAKQRLLNSKAVKLSAKSISELVQYAPFERLIKKKLSPQITRVSSDVVMMLMESTLEYIHDIICDSNNVALVSGKRKTLMVRDVACVVRAKGSAIVEAPDVIEYNTDNLRFGARRSRE